MKLFENEFFFFSVVRTSNFNVEGSERKGKDWREEYKIRKESKRTKEKVIPTRARRPSQYAYIYIILCIYKAPSYFIYLQTVPNIP